MFIVEALLNCSVSYFVTEAYFHRDIQVLPVDLHFMVAANRR